MSRWEGTQEVNGACEYKNGPGDIPPGEQSSKVKTKRHEDSQCEVMRMGETGREDRQGEGSHDDTLAAPSTLLVLMLHIELLHVIRWPCDLYLRYRGRRVL